MNDFDINEYNQYLRDGDYLGAANYLQARPAPTKEGRFQVMNAIDDLRDRAALEAKIVSNIPDEEDKNKYAFYKRISQGYVKRGEPVDDEYLRVWDSLGDTNNRKAEGFTLTFNSKDDYDIYLKHINLGEDQLKDNHIFSAFINGKYNLQFAKSNDLYVSLINAYVDATNEIKSEKASHFLEDMWRTGLGGAITSIVEGKNPFNEAYKSSKRISEVLGQNFPIIIKSYSGNKFIEGRYNNEISPIGGTPLNPTIRDILSLYSMQEDAKSVYDRIQNMSINQDVVLESISTDFINEADAELYSLMMRGGSTMAQYTAAKKDVLEKVYKHIYSNAFSQYEIWGTGVDDDKSEVVRPILDNTDRVTAGSYMRVAASENRLDISAGSSGGVPGTWFTVIENPDTKGEFKGEYNQFRRYFIPGFMNSDAERAIEASPATRAQQELNKHLNYGHTYNMRDGGRITGFDTVNSINRNGNLEYVDSEGNRQKISREDALNFIQDDLFLKGLSNQIIVSLDDAPQNINSDRLEMMISPAIDKYITEVYGYNRENTPEESNPYYILLYDTLYEKISRILNI